MPAQPLEGDDIGPPDWNNASIEVESGTGPESREWAIRHLIGNFPNRNGVPDRSRADATKIVDGMLGKREPWLTGYSTGGKGDGMTAGEVVDYASSRGFLLRELAIGWIDRSGKLFSCSYASHELLLQHVLGMETRQAEDFGWVRLAMHGRWRCRFRLSMPQRRKLTELGCAIDLRKERIKPTWVAPGKAAD